jgi:hypothetical protein
MADYYPLLSRAIASLGDQPGISHQAIYDRARDALGRQLRGFEPPLGEDHIAAELAALEETIARVEREHTAGKAVEDELFGLKPPASPEADERDDEPPPLPEADRTAEDTADKNDTPTVADDEALRPQRPRLPSRDEDQPRSSKSVALFAAVAVVVMMITGLIALTRRDQPKPAAPPAVATVAPEPPTTEGPKTEGRLGGAEPTPATPPATQPPAQPQPASPAPATPSATPTPSTPPARPAPSQPPVTATPATPATPPAAQAVPAAGSRAFMVLEAQGTAPNQFEGRVNWSFAPDPAVPGAKALRATIDFQNAGLAVDFSIARNTDTALNASHTVMVIFEPKNGTGNVREMSAVEWRERENQVGVTLAGIVVPVQDNIFMIGLDKTDAALARNLGLLQNQKWMVFEIRLANARRGAILVEKGPNGDKAVAEALAEWK